MFGSFLGGLDDLEVEAFEDGAVPVLTFHQAKGLEFDHLHVASTGRPVDYAPALRTAPLQRSEYALHHRAGRDACRQSETRRQLAEADRDRIYVALTRAKQSLSVLAATGHRRPFMATNPAIDTLFSKKSSERIQLWRQSRSQSGTMRDVIEVSYTGDLLAHRRCAGHGSTRSTSACNPMKRVQAMEGRLVHHAMGMDDETPS